MTPPDAAAAEAELLGQVTHFSAQWERASAISTLAYNVDPVRQADFLREAFAAVRKLRQGDRWGKIFALAPALKRWLPTCPDCRKQACDAANSISAPGERARTLLSLVAWLPDSERAAVIDQAMTAAQRMRGTSWRVESLARTGNVPAGRCAIGCDREDGRCGKAG